MAIGYSYSRLNKPCKTLRTAFLNQSERNRYSWNRINLFWKSIPKKWPLEYGLLYSEDSLPEKQIQSTTLSLKTGNNETSCA